MEKPYSTGKQKNQFKPSGRRKGAAIRSPEHQSLVRHLIAARKAAGLTQEELALKIGKHQSHISRLEKAERDVSVLDLVAWCHATDIPLLEFISKFDADLKK